MKYLEKLIGAIAAIGFTSVAAVSIVSNSEHTQVVNNANDLTKSFSNNYNPVARTIGEQAKWGLWGGSDKYSVFTFANIDHEVLTSFIKPLPETAVTVVTAESDWTKFPPASALGQELAQITQNTPDGHVAINKKDHTISLNFTLKLWKNNGVDLYPGVWVEQPATMVVTVHLTVGGYPNNLSNVTKLNDISKININTKNVKAVTADEIIAAKDFKDSIASALIHFGPGILDHEYSVALASSTTGADYTNLDLSTASHTYVQLTANKDAGNLVPNSKTDWLRVNLANANDLSQITSDDFGLLTVRDFSDIKFPTIITRSEIIGALTKNASLITKLNWMNSNISYKIWYNELNYKISKTADGADMGDKATVNAADEAGVTIYITITPGTSQLVSGIASDAGQGIAVHIPHIPVV